MILYAVIETHELQWGVAGEGALLKPKQWIIVRAGAFRIDDQLRPTQALHGQLHPLFDGL